MQLAEPLESGDWCEFCNNKLAVTYTADDPPVAACQECATEYSAAMAKYEDEMAEVAGLHFGPSRAQRRKAERHSRRLNNDGSRKRGTR